MVVKPGHPHVDCPRALPLLLDLSFLQPSRPCPLPLSPLRPRSPLYAHQNPINPTTPSFNPNPNPNTSSSHPPTSSSSLTPSSSSSSLSSRIYSSLSPYVGRISPSPQAAAAAARPTEEAAEVYRRNRISKVVDMVHDDMAGLRRAREAEMEGLFSTQAELRRREEEVLSKGLREMLEEKEGLEQQLQLILMNTDVLEGWVRENEGRRRAAGDVDVDDAFEPADVLEGTTADLVVEDMIYSLDKTVQEGSIPLDMYLNSVRGSSMSAK